MTNLERQIKATTDKLWNEIYPGTNPNNSADLYQEMYEWLYNGDGIGYDNMTTLAAEWNEYQNQS